MIKSIEQINREFMAEKRLHTPIEESLEEKAEPKEEIVEKEVEKRIEEDEISEKSENKRKRSIVKITANVLFYAIIVFTFITAIYFSAHPEVKFNIFGYSGFTVLGGSMQSHIPEGSLVLTKSVDPDDINIDDDITFVRRRDDSLVTHRIISIHENYGENHDRGFRTKGTDNENADEDMVFAEDIIGVVKIVIPCLGFMLNNISSNLGLLLTAFGLITILLFAVKKAKKSKQTKVQTNNKGGEQP